MCACKLERLFARLEQCGGPAEVSQRPDEAAFSDRGARERPLESDSRARPADRFEPLLRLEERGAGAGRLASFLEGLAEIRREEGGACRVVRRALGEILQAALEELDAALRDSELPVQPCERRERLRLHLGRNRLGIEHALELGHRAAQVAALREGEPEAGACPGLDEGVAVLTRVDEERAKALLRGPDVVPETKLELGVGEAQLTLVRVGERRARLQVLERDAELARENPKRLERGIPLPRLDPRDVRVRDSRSGKLALRKASFQAEAADSRADRLLAGRCVEVVHEGSCCFAVRAASTNVFAVRHIRHN
jgi:hypothetical protein